MLPILWYYAYVAVLLLTMYKHSQNLLDYSYIGTVFCCRGCYSNAKLPYHRLISPYYKSIHAIELNIVGSRLLPGRLCSAVQYTLNARAAACPAFSHIFVYAGYPAIFLASNDVVENLEFLMQCWTCWYLKKPTINVTSLPRFPSAKQAEWITPKTERR